jgi:hypothetical protein
MRKYLLAFLAALALVVSAYVANTSRTDVPTSQPRVLADTKGFSLH